MNRPFVFCHMLTSLDGEVSRAAIWVRLRETPPGKCFTISPLGPNGFTSIRAGCRAG